MDIEFRNTGGSRVGFIIGSDVKDSSGNRVGMIVGNDIKDSYGSRVGMLNGSDIKDTYGNRVGMIIGDDIKDTYGSRVGYAVGSASETEKAAAGLLLFGLQSAVGASSPSSSSSGDYSGNYSQYEDNAVYDDSSGDDYIRVDGMLVSKSYWQAMQGLASKLVGGTSVPAAPAVPVTPIKVDPTYVGDLVNGIPHGKGKTTYPNGAIYIGDHVNGRPHGKGKMTSTDGVTYEGDYVNGKAHGKGKKTEDRDVYEGDFVDNVRSGKGKYAAEEGWVYEGDFADNTITGKGKWTWPDGSFYEGDFVNVNFHGRGKITYANGDIFEGDFFEGNQNRKGKVTFTDGRIFVGEYKDGKRIRGKMTYPDGKVKEGDWDGDDFLWTDEEWARREAARKLKKIPKYLLSSALPIIASLWSFIIFVLFENKKMLVIEVIEDIIASENWLDLFFDHGFIFVPICLIFFAMLHFIPSDINWVTGLLRVLSIIAIGLLIICCLVFAIEIGARPVGWIGLGVAIGAFVMALVKPMSDMIDNDRAERERREVEYKEHYLKEKAREAKFKKIAIVAAASMVLSIIGLIMYNSQKNSLSIPVGVSSIEYRKYTRKQLVEVKIPDGVTTIGKESFKKNKLSDIEIPASVTYIGDNAFGNNKLTTITIGANVTLGSDAFDAGFDEFYTKNGSCAGTYTHPDKRSLDWRAWHNNFRYQYNDGAISILGYNSSGGDLIIPEEISGYPVTIIGKRAFFNKKLTSVTIPNSVTIIEEEAFLGGSGKREYNERGGSSVIPQGTISDVSIGTGVTTIGNSAFEYNKLSAIIIPNSVTSIGGLAFANNPVTSVRLRANVKLGDGGILGEVGFNTAYANNGMRAGTYTRPNTDSTTWTRR